MFLANLSTTLKKQGKIRSFYLAALVSGFLEPATFQGEGMLSSFFLANRLAVSFTIHQPTDSPKYPSNNHSKNYSVPQAPEY